MSGTDDPVYQFLLDNHAELLAFVNRRMSRRLGTILDPRDVIQDIWLDVIRGYGKTEPHDARAWLLRIATARICTLARRHRALKRGGGNVTGETGLTAVDRQTVILLQDLAIYKRTPSQSAMRRELILQLESALASISPIQRTVLQLRYLEGHSVAEVAGRIGRTEPAVWQLARAGLAAVRRLIDSNDG